jgi:uncharacterized surface protein with fasciclin (FAS1) repeats
MKAANVPPSFVIIQRINLGGPGGASRQPRAVRHLRRARRHRRTGGASPRSCGRSSTSAVHPDGRTTLVAAIQAAGLVDTLSGPGPFTVFAPTDAAFAALPDGALDDLLADPDALAEVLTYHVVAGELYAADVVGQTELETVQGGTVSVEVDGDTVRVGDATIVTTDIEASNGVIHVIDAVLLP